MPGVSVILASLIILVTGTVSFARDMSFDTAASSAAADVNISFTNQRGSKMALTFSPSASRKGIWNVSGNYVNNAPNTNCRGTSYPVQGVFYVSAAIQTISFSVAWSNSHETCSSTTGWTGYMTHDGSTYTINSNWYLVYNGGSGPAFLNGSDVFTSTNVAESVSLVAN